MKVLVISHNSFSKYSNNGKTLESIFSGFPQGSISQLYFNDSENPDLEFNSKYFRITDNEIIDRKIFFGEKPGNEVRELSQKNQSNKNISKKATHRNLMLSIRDLIWKMTFNKLDKTYDWLSKEKPDVIFYVGGDSVFSHRIALQISKKNNIPMAVYFTDDYVLNPKANNIIDTLRTVMLRKIFKNTVSHSKLSFAIGNSMQRAYTNFFSKNFDVVMNCIDIIPEEEYTFNKDEIVISYFGGLHLNRDIMILRFGKILSKVSREHSLKIIFKVYSAQPSEDIMNLYKENNIEYCGFVSPEAIVNKMKESDFLLHVESDSEYYKSMTKLSVSTKLPEYLISSIPILAFGPKDIASFELLSENEIGFVISCESTDEEIKYQLLELLSREEWVKERVKKGYHYAKNNFSRKENSSKLYNSLKKIIDENKR